MSASLFLNKTKIIVLFTFFILKIISGSNATGYNFIWPLGFRVDSTSLLNYFDFTGNSLRIDSCRQTISFGGSSAAISDSLGNLLFYTNGCVVMDSNHDTIPNSRFLPGGCDIGVCENFGSGILEGAIIFPCPSAVNEYYIFHQSCSFINGAYVGNRLYQTRLDKTLNNGLGGVLNNNILIQDTLFNTGIAGCKHANGSSWWLLMHVVQSNTFVKYLIDSSGISGPFYQNVGSISTSNNTAGNGRFSPDGNYFALAIDTAFVDLFHFERCTGDLTFLEQIPLRHANGCIEFSPSSRYMYVFTYFECFQMDLSASNVSSTKLLVDSLEFYYDTLSANYGYFCLPKLAPDGKIYCSTIPGTRFVHVINNPDAGGLNCNFVQRQIILKGPSVNMPNAPNYQLAATIYSCDSINGLKSFEYSDLLFSLSPNPSSDFLSLKFPEYSIDNFSFEIFNTEGKLVLSAKTNIRNIEVSHLPNGFYVFKVTSGNRTGFKKLIVNH